MRIVTVKPKDPVVLGRQGEHNVTQVRFDISQMVALYGEGVAELVYRRVGDAEPYPVPLERDGIYVVWTVTSVDTEKSGLGGKAELRWYVGDALAKSDTYSVSVDAAMGVAGEIPDPPGQTWLDQALEAGAQAKGSADAAQEAKAEAVGAKDAAVQAAEAAKTVAARPPIIMGSTGNWWVWSEEAGEYKDTGLSSYGPAGDDGAPGQRGTGHICISTKPASAAYMIGGVSCQSRIATGTVKREAGVDVVLAGDILVYDAVYYYPVLVVTEDYVYTGAGTSIKGAAGAQGSAGADGKTPYIANGYWYIGGVSTGVPATGPAGADGYTPVKGKDYWTEADKEEIADEAADKLEQRVDWLPTIDVVADDLLAEQTITLKPYYNNGYNYYSIVGDDAFSLVGGQKYIVTWDGIEYECTATVDTSTRVPITFVGGYYVEGFGFSEYPFAIQTNEENTEYDWVKQALVFSNALEDTTASYDVTVRIQAITETYNKMPAGFLPDDLSTDSVALDTTLTEEGKAADAKAVGDAIGQLSKVNADWSVSDESDPAYVKNRTHYEETADVTVFTDDQGVFLDQTGDGINDQLYMPVGVDIRLGETYIVTYNGVEYECVSQDFMQGADDILYFVIGNASAYDGLTGNGEPFLVHYCPGLLENAGENYSGYVERTTAFAIDSCSIVAKNRTVVHKLPSKFLPDDLSTGSVTLDATLTEEGQAADAKATGDAISRLSQDIEDLAASGGAGGTGISAAARNLLISILRAAVYSTDQSVSITALNTALGGSSGDSGDGDSGVVTYMVVNALENVENSNSASSVESGSTYTATLTATGENTLTSVTISMGGVDITSTAWDAVTGNITIASVTGDVIITATAKSVQSEVLELVYTTSYPNVTTFAYTEQDFANQYVVAKQGTIQGGTVSVDFDNTVYGSFNINFYVFDADGNPYCQTDNIYSGTTTKYQFNGDMGDIDWEDVGAGAGFGATTGPFSIKIPDGCTFIACMRRSAANTVYPEGDTNVAFSEWVRTGGVTITVTG